jgi:hypothetical protein
LSSAAFRGGRSFFASHLFDKEIGFISAAIDVKSYADLSFVEEAARRLK